MRSAGPSRFTTRQAGVLLPLFSVPSRRSWGVGELGDLPRVADWMRRAELDVLMVLPLNEMNESQHSPYAAVSGMAIDPIYVSLDDVREFESAGRTSFLSLAVRAEVERVRTTPRVDYTAVRTLKLEALRRCFARFVDHEWTAQTPRARALADFVTHQAWWLNDYTLYRVLRDCHDRRPWWEWPTEYAQRDPQALRAVAERFEIDRLFFSYVQWLAETQWQRARAEAAIDVCGDLPFMVSADSADVWAEQHAFRFDATVGAPPDAFSDTGQDWGLPVYRWDVFAAQNDAWLRARARRAAALFDLYRVDHVVGFYRTYAIGVRDNHREFMPPDEPQQLAQGERVMSAFLEGGAGVVAEDLGTVPTFVRQSLERLGIPGYKVLRWERYWDHAGQPFKDPRDYPLCSIATTGTHDTETLADWWATATREERQRVAQIAFFESRPLDIETPSLTPDTHAALLEALWASGSSLVIIPIQDVFGWTDRINTPATITEENWTWRLPWPVDTLLDVPLAYARAEMLASWGRAHGRVREAQTVPTDMDRLQGL